MASNVTLQYGDLTETIPLFEGRLHILTIKDAFTLRVARIDSALAPVDSQGFIHAIFKPGVTVNISGTSALLLCQVYYTQRGLLQWHFIPWYNMMCTVSILGTVLSAFDAKQLCTQVLDCQRFASWVLLWCFLLVAH